VRAVQGRGRSVILSTHFMEEAERLCDRVAILDHGRIVALDTPAALVRSLGVEERVVFSVDNPLPEGFEKMFASPVRIGSEGNRVSVQASNGRSIPLVSEVVGLLAAQGIAFRDLRTESPDLEDVFLSLTGRKMRE
jgi:ABC-2 type transport system ATP-binding protein